ncbi:MAG: SPASM domain-containing protein [Halanaerobiales bacterium]|nr:SPASM domain-containing protein [Halanaerobiales bacterium]
MAFNHKLNEKLQILLYQNKDRFFLLDLKGLLFAEIDYLYYRILIDWNGENDEEINLALANQFTDIQIKEAISEIRCLIAEEKLLKEFPEKQPDEVPGLLWFHMTDLCNMRCRYCFNHDGKEKILQRMMTFEIAKKAIDYYFGICKDSYTYFHFIGGEPLLNFPVIKEIVIYIEEEAMKREIRVGYIITTNAVAMTEEIAKFLAAHKFSVVVSIDGDEDCQNQNRLLPDGGKSYAKVIEGYETLRKYLQSITAKVTLTKQTVGKLKSIKEHLHLLGFKSVSYQLVVSSLSDLVVNEDDLEQLKNTLQFLAEDFEKDICNFKYFDRFMGWMEKIYKKPYRSGCGFINQSKVVVDPDGYLYTCEMAVGDKDFIVGEVEEGVNLDKYQPLLPPSLKERPICKDCWLRKYCDGGCYYFSYLQTGDFDHPNPIVCKEIKESFLKSIYIYTTLYIKNPEIIEMMFGNRVFSKEDLLHALSAESNA